jgi:hypothetical protein
MFGLTALELARILLPRAKSAARGFWSLMVFPSVCTMGGPARIQFTMSGATYAAGAVWGADRR